MYTHRITNNPDSPKSWNYSFFQLSWISFAMGPIINELQRSANIVASCYASRQWCRKCETAGRNIASQSLQYHCVSLRSFFPFCRTVARHTRDKHHVLYHLFPDRKTGLKYDLRPCRHEFTLSRHLSDCNLITRLLYKDCYWLYTIVA